VDDFIEVECNFIPKKIVGYGATSVVYKAYQSLTAVEAAHEKLNSATVAIKKVKQIFGSDIYTHRVLRELRLLRILRGHKYIVKLKSIMRPSDSKNFDSINLVFEYCT
jgi:serine/threonine protein kinase